MRARVPARPRTGISDVQQGVACQQLFSTYGILSSRGRLEFNPALTDDERRDFEIHIRGEYVGIAVQVKSAKHPYHGRATHHGVDYLNIRFPIRKDRISNDPRFWYFLAAHNIPQLNLRVPTFLVPAKEIHEHCRYGPVRKGHIRITFLASMAADAHDRWVPYRIPRLNEIGPRLESVIRTLPKSLRTSREEAARLGLALNEEQRANQALGRLQGHQPPVSSSEPAQPSGDSRVLR